jgi:hypothetical protein
MNRNAETGGDSMSLTRLALGILAIAVCLAPNYLCAQIQAIDVNKSILKIRVFKSGAFSAFAHDHEVQAPIDEGKIDSSASPSVQLRVDSRKMRVLDPEISVDKRAEIQHTMEGNAVLDVEHFPEISYRSTAITKTRDALGGAWESKPAWKESAGCCAGFLRSGPLPRFRIFQAEQLRYKSNTHRRRSRQGQRRSQNRIRYRPGSMRGICTFLFNTVSEQRITAVHDIATQEELSAFPLPERQHEECPAN